MMPFNLPQSRYTDSKLLTCLLGVVLAAWLIGLAGNIPASAGAESIAGVNAGQALYDGTGDQQFEFDDSMAASSAYFVRVSVPPSVVILLALPVLILSFRSTPQARAPPRCIF